MENKHPPATKNNEITKKMKNKIHTEGPGIWRKTENHGKIKIHFRT